jgi:hypothetical protein
MSRSILSVLLLAGVSLALLAPRAEDPAAAGESLFNGKDLAGWAIVHDAQFEVRDGCLRLVTGMGWLRSVKSFRDFVLELEYRPLVEKYDSGIFFRAGLEGKPWPKDGWQVNLRYDALGGLVKGYRAVEPAGVPKTPVNKWAKLRLEVSGRKASLDIDGERAWDYDGVDAASGYIGIQAENFAFDFRNIRIRALPDSKP